VTSSVGPGADAPRPAPPRPRPRSLGPAAGTPHLRPSGWGRTDLPAPFDFSVRQQTIDTLRRSILSFELKPGQRLIEREFIERLGISRTTFREAIRELAAEGLITVVAQKGASVSAPSLEEAMDLYEVRAALESLLVTRFVERADDREVRALRAAVKNFKRAAARTTDTLELLRAKELFYDVLVRGARSNALQQLVEGIKVRVHVLRATSMSHSGRVTETVAELEAIVAAIAGRDAARAAHLCEEHVRNACRTALQSLSASGDAGAE
jgi:DNA-binding GntR family transcriptional regulator